MPNRVADDYWPELDDTAPGEPAEAAPGGGGGMVITLDDAARTETLEWQATPFEAAPDPPARPVRARILWPALGFPAIIAPRPGATGTPLASGDATRCLTLLLLSDWKYLGAEDVARYLRIVPWKERGRRHIPDGQKGSFRWQDLEVRNDAGKPGLYHMPPKDVLGEIIGWGGDQEHTHAVAGNLAAAVTEFYTAQGLKYLHEIRVSEQASAAVGTGMFHLFWNNLKAEEQAPSDELALLLEKFAPARRSGLGHLWEKFKGYFLKEYEFEYRPLHPVDGPERTDRRTEILHPVRIQAPGKSRLRIGHATDLHVEVRADSYGRNLAGTSAIYNNWNASAEACYRAAATESNIVLLTGDLIDFGRGFWGRKANESIGKDSLYQVDRNWFYLQDILASGDAYQAPTYTSLGNHDWRINPYPPFAIAGAPSTKSYFHDHRKYTKDQLKDLLRKAHGNGHDRLLSYRLEGENRPEKDPWRDLVTIISRGVKWVAKWAKVGWEVRSAVGNILLNTSTLDHKHLPTETAVASVEWYLLAINPFLDYAVELPTGHKLLMLDWAEDEDVLFPIVQGGQSFPYLPWQAATAADPGPKARRCLTPLQQQLVTAFLDWQGPKVIGIHAPPIGPYPDWLDGHMLAGRAIYVTHRDGKPVADVARARGPTNFATRYPDGRVEPWFGHPIFAVTPKSGAAGMVPDYGSFDSQRDWFIGAVALRPDVRAIFSGHIHRNGLYVVNRATAADGPAIAGQLLVQGLLESQVGRGKVPRAAGPLFVNTTSAGPRGNFKRRSESAEERERGGLSVDPGFAKLDLAADGAIERVAFGFIPTGVKPTEVSAGAESFADLPSADEVEFYLEGAEL